MADDRRHVSIHRVDRFEDHDPGPGRVEVSELALEVGGIVVGEYALLRPAVADPRDHRCVVRGVGEEDAPREMGPEGGKGGLVGSVAGAEEERRLGSVEVRELLFEQHMAVRRAGDVAGAPGARAVPVDGVLHGGADDLVLAHSEVVVGAPDDDVDRAGGRVVDGPGEAAALPLQVREHPVPALGPEVVQPVGEEAFVVQCVGPRAALWPDGNGRPTAGRTGAGMVTRGQALPRAGRARSRRVWSRREDGGVGAAAGASRRDRPHPGGGGWKGAAAPGSVFAGKGPPGSS